MLPGKGMVSLLTKQPKLVRRETIPNAMQMTKCSQRARKHGCQDAMAAQRARPASPTPTQRRRGSGGRRKRAGTSRNEHEIKKMKKTQFMAKIQ